MAGSPTYTAQTELSSTYGDNQQLSGSISISGGGQEVIGFSTKFDTELKVGDSLQFADTGGTITTREVLEIKTSSSLTLASVIGGTAVSNLSLIHI